MLALADRNIDGSAAHIALTLYPLMIILLQTYTFETESHPTAKKADELTAAMMKLMAAPQLDPAAVKHVLSLSSESTSTPAAPVEPTQKKQQTKKGKRA